MSWMQYRELISQWETDPEAWAQAKKGNPNDPHQALRIAVQSTAVDDVVNTIFMLVSSVEGTLAVQERLTAERDVLLDACQRVHHWLDVKWERPLSEAENAILLILEKAIAKATPVQTGDATTPAPVEEYDDDEGHLPLWDGAGREV